MKASKVEGLLSIAFHSNHPVNGRSHALSDRLKTMSLRIHYFTQRTCKHWICKRRRFISRCVWAFWSVHWLFWTNLNFADGFGMIWICACAFIFVGLFSQICPSLWLDYFIFFLFLWLSYEESQWNRDSTFSTLMCSLFPRANLMNSNLLYCSWC